VSVIYDLTGRGKTSIRASYSYYFSTKITLANSLGGLSSQPELVWGSNQSSGRCSTTAGASCWTDANMDGWVQINELIGTPDFDDNYDLATGKMSPNGNTVDPSAKIGRTREVITGLQHELMANLAVGVEYVYRNYDRGTTGYTLGYQPGTAGFPIASIYTERLIWTDQVYQGIITTINKRFSNRWQMNGSLTIQDNPGYQPFGPGVSESNVTNPTGWEFSNGYSTIARYLFKLSGSYSLPWQINVSGNLNINDGANRTVSITGPDVVYGGVNANGQPTTIRYQTLNFQANGTTRLEPIKLLDFGVHKIFNFNGGRNRVRLMFDAFNVFNINTVTGFSSNNMSSTNFVAPSSIVPPRVFRFGAQVAF
jgi:hypothetical protein